MQAEAHRELGRAYRLLSNLYLRLPDRGLRTALSAEIVPTLRSLMGLAGAHRWKRAGEEAAALLEAIASLPAAPDLLTRDFTRLFRGVRPGYGPKPPYESLYRGEKAVMGDIAAEVKKSYKEAGLSLDKGFRGEPPDHIAFELFFMGHLHLLEAALREEGKRDEAAKVAAQREAFLAGHISQWIPAYCDAIEAEAKEDFYKGIASLTREMLLLEQR